MSRLLEDVHAAASVVKALEKADDPANRRVSAIEQGNREKPDGTREWYQRVEFF